MNTINRQRNTQNRKIRLWVLIYFLIKTYATDNQPIHMEIMPINIGIREED